MNADHERHTLWHGSYKNSPSPRVPRWTMRPGGSLFRPLDSPATGAFFDPLNASPHSSSLSHTCTLNHHSVVRQPRATSIETYPTLHRTGTSSCIRSPAMDSCTKPKADMQTMDLESGASSSQVKLTTPQRHTSSKLVLGLAISALILSLVGVGLGIAANVRAGNNRSSLRDISRDDGVILVNSIRKADSEYKNAGALFAGTGYWARMRDMLFQRSDLRVSGHGRDTCLGQSNCAKGHMPAGWHLFARNCCRRRRWMAVGRHLNIGCA